MTPFRALWFFFLRLAGSKTLFASVTQAIVEMVANPPVPSIVVTQAVIEIAEMPPPPPLLVTQAVIEIPYAIAVSALVTQSVIEIITDGKNPEAPCCNYVA